jgi:hypothetical protein
MLTNLNANDSSSRLVEVLAGSTALLSDTNGAATGSGLPLSLGSLTGDTTADGDQPANASADIALAPLSLAPIEPATALLHDPLGGTSGNNLLGLGEIFVDNDGAGTDASALDLANANEPLQPGFDATNVLVKDIHVQLETLSHQTGTSDIVHAITGLGETVGLGNTGVLTPATDGHTNLVTDVVNLPGTLLDGGVGDAVSQIGGDLGDTLHATTGLLNAVLNGSDPLNPVPELINGLGADLQNIPLLTVNGGNGGLLGGIVGDLSGSSSGHLIDVDAGPHDANGLGLDLLAAPGAGAHTAEVNAIDVGPNGPQLVDLGVLTGDTINIPSLNGAGTDGLVGNVLGSTLGGDIASGNDTSLPVAAPIDIAAVHDVLSGPIGGDHGVLDLHSAHIL